MLLLLRYYSSPVTITEATIAEATSVAVTISIATASVESISSTAVAVVLSLGLRGGIVGRGFFTRGESDQIGECNGGDCARSLHGIEVLDSSVGMKGYFNLADLIPSFS